jgi:hypothetical protein
MLHKISRTEYKLWELPTATDNTRSYSNGLIQFIQPTFLAAANIRASMWVS